MIRTTLRSKFRSSAGVAEIEQVTPAATLIERPQFRPSNSSNGNGRTWAPPLNQRGGGVSNVAR